MDAPEEDQDIKLQRISSDLIEDFDRSLLPYLRKSDGSGGTIVRRRVRSRETGRLVSTLLDPFQELPQLLDPQLPKWLPVLAESFLEYLQTRRRSKPLSTRSDLLMPLSAGICRILYTFCKIRGEKVVVRFLNNETRYLDVLLSALEDSERKIDPAAVEWTWEQRYVVLLWLSHLFLAPFDLATISSVDVDEEELPAIPGFQWPANLPAITVRILPLAIKYLASPGKERDAAKALLVRVAMRRDMQDLGVLDALVQWALASLRLQKDIASQTSYYHIGVLSFLAGILASSANTSDMDKYLFKIFEAAHAASSDSVGAITSSALARKTLIKVMRSITVLVLRNQQLDMAGTELVETTIGHLLERLADNDTPVRLAASKALSVTTLKLDMEMASQVVEAVLESLSRNVLWTQNPTNPSAAPTRDLSAVDPLEWHGLMLTLSHLLYRRSPPAEKLSDIIQALLMGLSFEQRSSSGNTVGTNVRDASCFGIWAIARRYTTKELLAVPTKSISAARHHPAQSSVLQILATELIVTASLDPAGNIRRGSSAALQELIGRHPDVAEKGIWVVQTVDYHAVALRARAIQQVALEATRLAAQYGEAMLEALLSWRGIGDVEPAARRVAAASFGVVAAELVVSSPDPVQQLSGTIEVVLQRLRLLQHRQVEERHGLLLAFAAVLDHFPALMDPAEGRKPPSGATMDGLLRQVMGSLEGILTDCKTKTHRRPELVAEAASRLVVSSFPLFQAAMLGPNGETESLPSVNILPGPVFVSSTTGTQRFSDMVSALDSVGESRRHRIRTLVPLISSNLSEWMKRSEHENIVATSQTGLVFLSVCEPDVREETIRRWAEAVRLVPTSRTGSVGGQFAALVKAYPTVSTLNLHQPEDSALICNAILERWAGDKDIDTRVSILQSLTQSAMLKQNAVDFLGLVEEGLDDYTTDARGDVGSHVRLQAIRATGSLWQTLHDEQQQPEGLQTLVSSSLFLRILRLAAEKLDRVRVEAQTTLALALGPDHAARLSRLTFSSRAYFRFLLDLLSNDWLHPAVSATAKADPDRWMGELMAGYVSSADTGNEDLVIASRAALTDFCDDDDDGGGGGSPASRDAVCAALARNLGWRRRGALEDRVVVPSLEMVAFLARAGVLARCGPAVVDRAALCLGAQRACYKTGNVRKIEACIRVYGAVAALAGGGPGSGEPRSDGDGGRQARRRLGALLFHPWPRVRAMVIDELWGLISGVGHVRAERLKGVDWGRAEKGAIKELVEALDLA